MRDLFFVSCTPGAKEETHLYRSLQKQGICDYFFFEHNRRGLSECYNEYLDKLAGTDRLLVLVHSDVTIADIFFREKLSEAAKRFNVVGLVGSSSFDLQLPTEHYCWPIWPPECLSGAVEHVLESGLSHWSRYGPTPRRCVILDGVLLAIDMLTLGNVRFDTRFTFDLYDLDFCLTAHFADLVLGTTNVYVQHASEGKVDSAAYQRTLYEFRSKWNAMGSRPL